MKIACTLALATLMAVAALPATAFNLNDAVNAVVAASGDNPRATTAPEAAGLLNTLGGQLDITPEQAIGGTGALLGLARNTLSGSDYSQLNQAVPGLDQLAGLSALASLGGGDLGALLGGNNNGSGSALGSVLGNVRSMDDVNTAFSALGMDSSLVSQFVPLILQYLGQQGASGSVLQRLGGVWGGR